MFLFNSFDRSLFIVRLASLLVPALYRESWRSEWESEAWHACHAMRDRGEPAAFVRSQLRQFCAGSFNDAVWHRCNLFDAEETLHAIRNAARGPGFCLACIMGATLLIGLLSGFFPATRSVVLPLPYANADRIATISRAGVSLSARSGIPNQWVRWWTAKSKLLDGAASYRWNETALTDSGGTQARVIAARVSENFFPLLSVRVRSGRAFERGDFQNCFDCAVLSYDFWRKHFAGAPVSAVRLGGQRYRVIGVLDRGVWFLSRHIAVWSLAGAAELAPESTSGVVVRLSPGVTKKAAESELSSILVDEGGLSPWYSIVDISLVHERVRSVFGSFALALVLAVAMAMAGLRFRLPQFGLQGCARMLFFSSKTALALLAVLLAGLEFTRASSITMLGGTDLATEPLSTWLFLIASMGVLSWSIYDQRRRCRVCLRRLGLAAHVGCPGCLLLNWSGTELVCMEGHGMLHVPEMMSSWHEAERWTALDESWLGLFER